MPDQILRQGLIFKSISITHHDSERGEKASGFSPMQFLEIGNGHERGVCSSWDSACPSEGM